MLRTGGTVALQTYAGLEDQPGYGPFIDTVVRHAGAEARELMGTYWSKGDVAELRTLLQAAELDPTAEESVLGQVTLPSIDALVHTEIQATPLAERIDESAYGAISEEARQLLAPYVDSSGMLRLPIRARFITSTRPG